MTPCKGHFLVGFALEEKVVQAGRDSGSPDTILSVIDEAPKCAEGRGVRLEIRNRRDREDVKKLAALTMAN